MLMTVGQSFSIKEQNITVATGIITEILGNVVLQTTQLGRNELK